LPHFDAAKLIDFAALSLYYECLRFISSAKRAILQSDNNRFRRFRAASAAVLGIVLTAGFASCSFAVDADVPGGKPQIQGGNVRIEFDNHLRSRVVSSFDKAETVIGPFPASGTAATADKPWAGFLLTSQKHERTKDAFAEGERLTVEGKAGELKKTFSVPQ
jgi:alpha-galactosidase